MVIAINIARIAMRATGIVALCYSFFFYILKREIAPCGKAEIFTTNVIEMPITLLVMASMRYAVRFQKNGSRGFSSRIKRILFIMTIVAVLTMALLCINLETIMRNAPFNPVLMWLVQIVIFIPFLFPDYFIPFNGISGIARRLVESRNERKRFLTGMTAAIALLAAIIFIDQMINDYVVNHPYSARIILPATSEKETPPERGSFPSPQSAALSKPLSEFHQTFLETATESEEAVCALAEKLSANVSTQERGQAASELNQVMDELLDRPVIPADYGATMAALYRNTSNDVIARDFAVQHIGLYAQALNRGGIYDLESDDAHDCRDTLFAAAAETKTIIAAAAFRALFDMSAFDPHIDNRRLDAMLVSCVGDAAAATAARVMAAQLCGERGVTSAMPALKGILADAAAPATLRRAAKWSLSRLTGDSP